MAGLSAPAGATTLFDATSQTGAGFLSGAIVTHYAETVTLAGPSTQGYTINYFPRFAINWSNISSGKQDLFLDFYTGVNLSSSSTNAFANATYIGYVGFALNAPTATGGSFYDFGNASSPLVNEAASTSEPLIIPGNTFTVVATMVNSAQTAYSTAMNGYLSTGTPATGTDPLFVWLDTNQDGTFAGSEQYQYSSGPTNIAMSIDATAIVPSNVLWNSSTGGNWEDSTKWNPNTVPSGTSGIAVFNLSSPAPGYTVALNAADNCYSLEVLNDNVTLSLATSSTASLNVVSNLSVGVPAANGPSGIKGSLTLASSGFGTGVVTAGTTSVGSTGNTGTLTIGSGVELVSTGTFNTAAGSTTIVQNNGILFGVGTTYVAGSLVLQSGALLGRTNLTLAGSTNQWTGKVDITDGFLDLPTASLATVTNQVAQAYNLTGGANWNGPGGITSSTAAGDTAHLTAVGVIQNNQGGTAIYGSSATTSTFGVFGPGAGDILVRYTYFGDANLDGVVDGSDYSLIDAGYASNQPGFTGTVLTGWYNGDFNYDGVIDGSDYALIDNAYNNQGSGDVTQLGTSVLPTSALLTQTTARAVSDLPVTYSPLEASGSPVASTSAEVAGAAVPEPASLAFVFAGLAIGAGRRRRRV
jgi:hypothetical protein